jgi:hypothetical protein
LLRGEYVGKFDSLVCPICHYSALTSLGYAAAITKAEQMGLIGPPELEATLETVDQTLTIPVISLQSNFGKRRSFATTSEKEHVQVLDTLESEGTMSTLEPMIVKRLKNFSTIEYSTAPVKSN